MSNTVQCKGIEMIVLNINLSVKRNHEELSKCNKAMGENELIHQNLITSVSNVKLLRLGTVQV
jgi:hypothetical protein